MSEFVQKKRGRPRKEVARRNRVQCKMTDEEYEMLHYLCEKNDKTITAVLLDSVKISYNLEKFKK